MLQILHPAEIDVVSVSEVKAHLRIDHDIEDSYLLNLVQAATDYIENYIKQSLIMRTYIYRTENVNIENGMRKINLPMGPIHEIVSIHGAVTENIFDKIINRYVKCEGGICIGENFTQPIEIAYRAGLGIYPKHIPAAIKQAILMIVNDIYENRLGFSMEKSSFVRELLAPYQRMSLCM
jgi:hypothetical protein